LGTEGLPPGKDAVIYRGTENPGSVSGMVMLEYKTQRSNKTNSTDDALHEKSGNKKPTQSNGVCGLPEIINQKYQKSGEEK
jgi:hypothetical protein